MLHNGPHCRPKKRAAPARGRGTCGGVMSHGLFSGYGERSSGYNYRTALPGLVGPTAVVPDHRVRQRGSGSRPGRAWSGAADRWPDLGVPVIASPGAVAVAGQPAWLPAPQPVPSQGELSVTKPEMAHGMSVINFQSVLACSHHPGTVPAARRGASRSRRSERTRLPLPRHPGGALHQRRPGHMRPLHRHLLRGYVVTLAGSRPDPGRDVLCLLTSPPWSPSP